MATTTTTMMPRKPRSFNASKPPTSALPALPSLTPKPSLQAMRRTSLLPTSPGGPRSPGGNLGRRISVVPSLDTSSLNAMKPKRAVSIAESFPQPPRSGARVASLPPPSPSGFGRGPGGGGGGGGGISSSPLTSPSRMRAPGLDSPKRPNTISSSSNPSTRYSRDSGLGFLSGASTTSGTNEYTTSPPHSRSSSAQDSYSTNPTTVAVSPAMSGDDLPRGRSELRETEKAGSGGNEKEMKGNVLVSIRVRPDGPEDQMSQEWWVDGRRGQMGYRGKDGGKFEYDNVFTQSDNNAQVYESCAKRLVRRVMEGYHGTVFAYGMTGTGKTYSMQGTTSSPGVIPLAITDIFSYIRETPHREFLLRVSYLEIYNERIHDLLSSQPGATGFVPLDQQTKGEEIKLREDPKRGVYATPLKEEIVQSPTQLLRVIARGDLCRRTGSTQYNARSSRSHAVVQIVVESRERVAGSAGGNMAANRGGASNGGVRVSTLSLIDLAGSERAAEDKERRTEGAHINKSLLTLGTVIARLSKDKEKEKDKDGQHLPYRDSKLTRLLQPALSGNSLISILCTISIPLGSSGAPNLTNIGETMNTLKFAARARNNIVSHAKKGDDFSGGLDAGGRALLERYRNEIGELRRELEQQKKKEEMHASIREQNELKVEREANREADRERHGEQLVEMQLARTALKERIEHLNRLIICSKSSGVNSARSSMIGIPVSHSPSARSSLQQGQTARLSTASSSANLSVHDGESSGSEFNDGNAPLAAQVRALQADLSDKNRYIATLEKRLLQARRSSQSRTSFGLVGSPRVGVFAGAEVVAEARMEVLLKEKDDEIAELRARLDDKERMVAALRSAARKRDVAEVCGRRVSVATTDDGGGAGKRGSADIVKRTFSGKGREPLLMVEEKDGMVECF